MHRRNLKVEDEEIDSDAIPDVSDSSEGNESESDNFFAPETADEIKLRKAEAHRRFIMEHEASDDEGVEKVLIQESEERAGTRFDDANIALSNEKPIRFRAHDKSPTALCIGPDSYHVFSASKDGTINKISIIDDKRERTPIGQLPGHVYCLAYNRSKKLLAAGCEDKTITVYDCDSTNLSPFELKGHRDAVTGLCFNEKGFELFSCSRDMNVRVWDVTNGNMLATLYGHQEEVLGIDYCNVLVTVGADRSLRLWKYIEEKQLLFQSSAIKSPIECISLFNNKMCVTGSQDGKLCLWDLSRKKPLWIVKDAHGKGNWISSVATLRYRKFLASGSCDGFVRFWEVRDKKLFQVFQVELQGYINDLQFSDKGDFLAVQVSYEQRLGRWLPPIHTKQGVYIIRFVDKNKVTVEEQ